MTAQIQFCSNGGSFCQMRNNLIMIITLMILTVSISAQDAEIIFSKSLKESDKATEFTSGDYIYAHLKFNKPFAQVLNVGTTYVSFTSELYAGSRLLAEEFSAGHDPDKVRSAKETTYLIPIVSNPDVDLFNLGSKKFAFEMPLGLSKLTPGTHQIELRVKSGSYKDGSSYLATGRFNLTIGPDGQAWYQKNEKDARNAQIRKGSSARVTSYTETTGIITLVNNCGRSVWLRYALGSDKSEYRLGAGQTMRYNTDNGYLEEWNFGTKKWNTITTMFKTDANGRANICNK